MSNYWQERMEQNLIAVEDLELEFEKTLTSLYNQAIKEMKSTLNTFYAEYAIDNKISLAEAKKVLTSKELSELKKEVQDYIQLLNQYEATNKKEFLDKLETMTSRVKVTRLQAIMLELEYELTKLLASQEDAQTSMYQQGYEQSYYNTVYNLQVNLGVGVDFTRPTKNLVVTALNEEYLGQNFSDRIWKNKDLLLANLQLELTKGFLMGKSNKQVAESLAKTLNSNYYSAETLARTEMNNICNQAALRAYSSQNVTEYEFLATLDMKTSEVCRSLDGKIFKVSEAARGVNCPPMHPNCYDEETKVLTNSGWKYFKDCSENDLFYSLNPETHIPEYLKASKLISYYYEGNMCYFKNRSFDLKVTPNHKMVLKYTKKDGANKLRFVAADKLPKYNNSIPRGIKWQGKNLDFVKLGDYELPVDSYLKFMAWYLSDGSCTKKGNSYQINIAQITHKDTMENVFKTFPFEIKYSVDRFYFNDKSIGGELIKYGKCNQKYIPDLIKELTPEKIKVFLDAYVICDGTIHKGKEFNNYKFKEQYIYFTTSEKLASDLGELILKVGGYPSYKLIAQKGDEIKINNKSYNNNYDVIKINWNTRCNVSVESLTREFVPYKGDVYCVELPKYHTLYVQRNGKCCWCGNCRSTTIPVIDGNKNLTRLAKGQDGYYEVGNISYKEWLKNYVDK